MSKSFAKMFGTIVDDGEVAKEIWPPASGVESTPEPEPIEPGSDPVISAEDEGLDKADIYGDVSTEPNCTDQLDVESDDDAPTRDIPLEKIDLSPHQNYASI